MIWLWAIVGALLAVMWAVRVIDAWFGMRTVPDLGAPALDRPPVRPDGTTPSLSIIVPARNEERHIERAVRSLLLLDYPQCEIIAVDDRSTDSTGDILDRLAAEAPQRLRVLHVSSLPPGWLGKTHAMWMAAQQATGDWLLFTDADVIFRHDSLNRAIAYAESASPTDHLVLLPRVETQTTGGHMMLAFFQMLFLFWHRPWKISDPNTADYIGFGPFNLIRHSVYRRLGTWQTLRMAVVEDMKLGDLVKRSGFTQRAAYGQQLVRHYWASDALGVVENLTKNFFALARYSCPRAVGTCVILLVFNLLPFVAVFVAPGNTRLGYGVALSFIAALYAHMSQQPHIRWWFFFLHPVSTVLYVYTMLRSMTLTLWRGGVIWRGTKYSLDELRREMS